nr:hypothetical protein [Paramuribaculum sp.]
VMNYVTTLGATTENFRYIFGYAEQYNSYCTKQFKDYSEMEANMFNAEEIEKRHETVFPEDEKNCYELGIRLVRKAEELNIS